MEDWLIEQSHMEPSGQSRLDKGIGIAVLYMETNDTSGSKISWLDPL